MDEPVISEFYTNYFVKAVCGGIIVLLLNGYMAYLRLFVNLANPDKAYFFSVFFSGLLCVYFYFFSKSWKRITVTPTEIIVFDVVFKKQLTIPYTDITRMATYRPTPSARSGQGFAENFVIEYGNNKSVTINEGHYDNYSLLKMAIYNYKLGPGRGRERYLARREREA
jgi:hypothetical protein